MKQTIILDFDGVLHSYSSGWRGADVIPDPPTEGARDAVAKLREKYVVVVVSSRSHQPGGIEAMKAWLSRHGIEVDDVPDHKPPHVCTVDDRVFRFEGDWGAVIEGLPEACVPWNKKGLAAQP